MPPSDKGVVICPECSGAKWSPPCSFCDGDGVIEYDDRQPVCPECGFPLYVRSDTDPRGHATFCEPCGKVR